MSKNSQQNHSLTRIMVAAVGVACTPDHFLHAVFAILMLASIIEYYSASQKP